jgi:type IV fimbrial biogenesis protein FimT
MPNSHGTGVTAFELMIAMAIVAILLAAGVPSVKHYSWNLRLRTAMDTLQTDLNLARGYAIGLGAPTIVCPSPDGSDCSGDSRWQDGWIVFTDLNADRRRQDSETLARHTGGVEMLTITSPQSRDHVRFYPNGSAPGSNLGIVFCDRRGARYAGRIVVSNTGRIRLETGGVAPTVNCP